MMLFTGSALHSQSENTSHFFSLAPTLQTNGYGMNFKWGRPSQSAYRFYSVDISRIRHQKEFRYIGNGRYNGFVYGRKNVAIPVNFGFGKHFILGVRNSKNDIGLSWNYQIGASMVLLKPVYLYIDESPGTAFSTEKLVRYNGESNVGLDNILGGASFFTGINQTQFVPGAYGKLALLFNWGKYYNSYHSLEIGMLVTGYARQLPLMANTGNSFIYPSLYINFNMGKFW